ncbi:hypothetical protein [Pseudomonas baetica]|nr:hypothetical protein [Pseudomonas baetica]MDF9773079.1 hypothetical protein [Pseudomonas baetica]
MRWKHHERPINPIWKLAAARLLGLEDIAIANELYQLHLMNN